LLYFRDRGNTEIGGFGVSAPHDPLLVVDIVTAKQRCTPVTVAFDDSAVADLFDDLVDEGLHPERFGRIWIHSHPGNCPLPSSIDEETFGRVFGRTDWSVMAIVARNDATYARLSFHVGPGGALEIPVNVDFTPPFDASDSPAWEQEYLDHVIVETLLPLPSVACGSEVFHDDSRDDLWDRESFDDGFTTAGSL
jgi:proteasome lid subunit RPN8/RPN11